MSRPHKPPHNHDPGGRNNHLKHGADPNSRRDTWGLPRCDDTGKLILRTEADANRFIEEHAIEDQSPYPCLSTGELHYHLQSGTYIPGLKTGRIGRRGHRPDHIRRSGRRT